MNLRSLLVLVGALMVIQPMMLAQTNDSKSDDMSCYRKWYKIFQLRGADEVPDGDYEEVIITLREGIHGSCFYGKVTVKGGTIRDIQVRDVEGKYENVNFDVKEKYEISNGISETILARLRGTRYELNVVFKDKLRPKGNTFDQAPDPDIDDYK